MLVNGKSHVYRYIPDFMGNRKLPEEEQIVIGLKVVPLAEFDNYQRTCMLNAKKMSVDKAQELNEKRFNELIRSKVCFIEGLEIAGHSGEIDFETLYAEVPDIAQEVIRVVMSTELLTAGEQKNFLPESDGASSAPARKRPATTAGSATKGKSR